MTVQYLETEADVRRALSAALGLGQPHSLDRVYAAALRVVGRTHPLFAGKRDGPNSAGRALVVGVIRVLCPRPSWLEIRDLVGARTHSAAWSAWERFQKMPKPEQDAFVAKVLDELACGDMG